MLEKNADATCNISKYRSTDERHSRPCDSDVLGMFMFGLFIFMVAMLADYQ